jgi:hypothetical protein
MKKDAYYFPHFSNARNDAKLIKIRRVLGIEGYGIYFMLLEVLREQTGFKFPLHGVEDLAYEWHVSKEKIFSVINDFGAFEIIDNEFISSKLILYLQPYIEKSERARLAAKTRWDKIKSNANVDANALPQHSKSNASKGKESKGEESKEYKTLPPTKTEVLAKEILREVYTLFDSKYFKDDKGKEKWISEIEKLLRLDKEDKQMIIDVIKFGRTDDFWKANFLSIGSIRGKNKGGVTKFDSIKAKMKENKQHKPQKQTTSVPVGDFTGCENGLTTI